MSISTDDEDDIYGGVETETDDSEEEGGGVVPAARAPPPGVYMGHIPGLSPAYDPARGRAPSPVLSEDDSESESDESEEDKPTLALAKARAPPKAQTLLPESNADFSVRAHVSVPAGASVEEKAKLLASAAGTQGAIPSFQDQLRHKLEQIAAKEEEESEDESEEEGGGREDSPFNNPVMPEEYSIMLWDGKLDYGKNAVFCLILGPSGSGKSFVIFWVLLQNRKKYWRVTYMSDEPETRKETRHWLPMLDVMKYSDEKVWKIIAFQSRLKEAGIDPPWQALVIDDCTNNKMANGKKEGTAVIFLAQFTRHLNLDVFWLGQKLTSCSTFLRTNAHVVVSGFVDVSRERNALQTEYFSSLQWFADTALGRRQFMRVYSDICLRPNEEVKERKMIVSIRLDASAPPEKKVGICAPTFPPEFFMKDGKLNFDMYVGEITSHGFWVKSIKKGLHMKNLQTRLRNEFLQKVMDAKMQANMMMGQAAEEEKYEMVEKEDAPVMQTFRKGKLVRQGKPRVRKRKKERKKLADAAARPASEGKAAGAPKVQLIKQPKPKVAGLATMFGGGDTTLC